MYQSLGSRHDSLGLKQKTDSGKSFGQGFPLGQSVDQDGKGHSGQTEKE